MRVKRLFSLFIVVLLTSSIVVTANAALINRGGGMIYDNVLDITWIADAGLANADAGVDLDWPTAVSWADNLVYGGYSDWRLPIMDVNGDGNVVTCFESGVTELECRDSEYGYLFFENGITHTTPGDFINIGLLHYWSSSENTVFPGLAWVFNLNTNFQGTTSKGTVNRHSIAVRDGDVAAVPLPPAAWLFGSGLIALWRVSTRKL